MKTRCDHCQARYDIPYERVIGKVLRVRCKRCQDVMVVVGPTLAFAEGDARPPTLTGIAAFSGEAPRGRLREDDAPLWWAGISGKPHGPYTKDEVLSLIDRGDVHARSRLWRAPWACWERVCESPLLGWAYERAVARSAEDAALLHARERTGVFERAALVSDGDGWFPDPTLKSGWIVLDEETQAYLETCARRGMFAEHRVVDDEAAPAAQAAAFEAFDAFDLPRIRPLGAQGTRHEAGPSLLPAFAAASLALGLAVTGLVWWAQLPGGII